MVTAAFAFTRAARRAIPLSPMSAIVDFVLQQRQQSFETGELVLEQDAQSGLLYVMLSGEVEVLRDNVRVARVGDRGAVFGEMSALLGGPHTATVRALQPSTFAIIAQPREFLRTFPDAALHIAALLARRLDQLNKYLIDVKAQYEGHDHLGMVDEVLDTLMHRQPREVR
jgi:CRP-like cAMP-binding protein